jgi:hypothetical protein
MNRTQFFNKATVNDVDELDFLYNTLSSFEMKREPSYYRTNAADVVRPDMISFKNYRTVRYWWIICLVNQIQNPFTEITEGIVLTIPDVIDIYEFGKKYRVR